MVRTNNKPLWWTTLFDEVERRREIDNMPADERERLASEIGVRAEDLDRIVSNGEGVTELMHAMMRAKGVDADMLATSFPGVLRSIEVSCSMCSEHGRCAHELAAGTAAQHANQFCPNAATLNKFSMSTESSRG